MDVYKSKGIVTKDIMDSIKRLPIDGSIERAVLMEAVLCNGYNKKLLDAILDNMRELNLISISNDGKLIKRL